MSVGAEQLKFGEFPRIFLLPKCGVFVVVGVVVVVRSPVMKALVWQ